tara:strand:+ start:274 stop:603 length:330 start_codon:yes stop_codon:yes gene_type:complete
MKNIAGILTIIAAIAVLFVYGKNQRELAFKIGEMQSEMQDEVELYDESKLDSMKADILEGSNDSTVILTVTKSPDKLYHLKTQYYEIYSLNEAELDSCLILLAETEAND